MRKGWFLEGKRTFDFSVFLSVAEMAEKLQKGLHGRIIRAQLLDEYRRQLSDGKEIRMLIFQKYSVLANDRPVLTVLPEEMNGKTQVHLCGISAVGGWSGIDLPEEGAALAKKAKEILEE